MNLNRVCGVDLSLTSTGIGVISQRVDHTTLATSTTITSRGKRADVLVDRDARLGQIVREIMRVANTCTLVVIETLYSGSKGGSLIDRAGLWWRVVHSLHHHDVPVATCVPTTRAKFAAGSGKADKAVVAAAVSRAWPDLKAQNNDEYDAVALAHAGAMWLGWNVPSLAYQREAIEKSTGFSWPSYPGSDEEVAS